MVVGGLAAVREAGGKRVGRRGRGSAGLRREKKVRGSRQVARGWYGRRRGGVWEEKGRGMRGDVSCRFWQILSLMAG